MLCVNCYLMKFEEEPDEDEREELELLEVEDLFEKDGFIFTRNGKLSEATRDLQSSRMLESSVDPAAGRTNAMSSQSRFTPHRYESKVVPCTEDHSSSAACKGSPDSRAVSFCMRYRWRPDSKRDRLWLEHARFEMLLPRDPRPVLAQSNPAIAKPPPSLLSFDTKRSHKVRAGAAGRALDLSLAVPPLGTNGRAVVKVRADFAGKTIRHISSHHRNRESGVNCSHALATAPGTVPPTDKERFLGDFFQLAPLKPQAAAGGGPSAGVMVTDVQARIAASALRADHDEDASARVCSCAAMSGNHANGRCNYTVQSLVKAIKLLHDGFPRRYVADNFSIPCSTLWDYTCGRKRLLVKHDVDCTFFASDKEHAVVCGFAVHERVAGEPERPPKDKKKLAKIVAPSTSQPDRYQLKTAWKNFMKPTVERRFLSTLRNPDAFDLRNFRLALRKCANGATVRACTVACRIPYHTFCRHVAFFASYKSEPKEVDITGPGAKKDAGQKPSPASAVRQEKKPTKDVAKSSCRDKPASPTSKRLPPYSLKDLMSAFDEVLCGDSTRSFRQTCTRWSIPKTTLRDCLRRNEWLHKKLIKDKRMAQPVRVRVLMENRHLVRVQKALKNTISLGAGSSVAAVRLRRIKANAQQLQSTARRKLNMKTDDDDFVEDNATKKKVPQQQAVRRDRQVREDQCDKAIQTVASQRATKAAQAAICREISIPLTPVVVGSLRPTLPSRRRVPALKSDLHKSLSSAVAALVAWGWSLDKHAYTTLVSEHLKHLKVDADPVWLNDFVSSCKTPPVLESTPGDSSDTTDHVSGFFNRLDNYLKDADPGSRPSQLYVVQEIPLARPGSANSSFLAVVNAAGERHPPVLVVRGDVLWEADSHVYLQPGTKMLVSSDGTLSAEVFSKWFEAFLRGTNVSPLLVLIDSSLTYLPVKVVLSALKRNVVALRLPYTSCQSSVQDSYRKLFELRAAPDGPGVPCSLSVTVKNLRKFWDELLTPENIVASFKSSGLFPVDRRKLSATPSKGVRMRTFCLSCRHASTPTKQTNTSSSTSSTRGEKEKVIEISTCEVVC